jgi:hypothetical protein
MKVRVVEDAAYKPWLVGHNRLQATAAQADNTD